MYSILGKIMFIPVEHLSSYFTGNLMLKNYLQSMETNSTYVGNLADQKHFFGGGVGNDGR